MFPGPIIQFDISITTAAASPTSTTGNSQSNAGAISGGVVVNGGLGFVVFVGLGTLLSSELYRESRAVT